MQNTKSLYDKLHKCCNGEIGLSQKLNSLNSLSLMETMKLLMKYTVFTTPSFSTLSPLPFSLRPCLEGGNGMKMNEKNNFKIFFPSVVWEF